MAIPLSIRVASAVADILVHEGGIPKSDAQFIMDRLADGLEKDHPHQLALLLAELRLVTDIRDTDDIEELTGEGELS